MNRFDLRPLRFGEILDRAFLLYRRNFIFFTGIAGIPATITPAYNLIRLFLFGTPESIIVRPSNPGHLPTVSGTVLLALAYVSMALVFYSISQGIAIRAVTEIYLGRQTSIADSFRRALGEMGTVTGTAFLYLLVIVLAFLALVVPGFHVASRLMVCFPVAVLENRGPSASLSRAWSLTSGYAGRSLVLLLTYVAVSFGIDLLTGAPLFVAALTQQGPATTRAILVLSQVQAAIASLITTPLILVVNSIYYFDLRVRKEGFDLQLLLDPSGKHVKPGRNSN